MFGGILGSVAGSLASSVVGAIFSDDADEATPVTEDKKPSGFITKPSPPSKLERYARTQAFNPNLSGTETGRRGRGGGPGRGLKDVGPTKHDLFWGYIFSEAIKEAEATTKDIK